MCSLNQQRFIFSVCAARTTFHPCLQSPLINILQLEQYEQAEALEDAKDSGSSAKPLPKSDSGDPLEDADASVAPRPVVPPERFR